MHVTLLQQTFSSSLGIGTQTRHLHHSGVSSAGGSGSFGSSSANFFAKSRLPLPILKRWTRILSFFTGSSVATNSYKLNFQFINMTNYFEDENLRPWYNSVKHGKWVRTARKDYYYKILVIIWQVAILMDFYWSQSFDWVEKLTLICTQIWMSTMSTSKGKWNQVFSPLKVEK